MNHPSDERQILNLVHRYAECVDNADFDGVSALFEHAEFHLEGASGQRGSQVGDVMRRTVALHDGSPRTTHVTTNQIIDLHGDSATCRSYFTVLQSTAALPLQVVIAGRYHDRFEKVDGAWRFADRSVRIEHVGDLSAHLRPGVIS